MTTWAAVAACAGFLLGVLWMDLMFDSQLPARADPVDEATLASIAGYYHRATTTAQPRGALIAATMVALVALLGLHGARGGTEGWVMAASAGLAGGPILLAWTRTVPAAVRLGRRTDPPAVQSRLARRIHRDHRLCLAGIAAFLALWLITGLSSN